MALKDVVARRELLSSFLFVCSVCKRSKYTEIYTLCFFLSGVLEEILGKHYKPGTWKVLQIAFVVRKCFCGIVWWLLVPRLYNVWHKGSLGVATR